MRNVQEENVLRENQFLNLSSQINLIPQKNI